VGSHVNRAVKTGLIERVGYGKYAVADGKPEAPEAPAKAESPAEESELHRIGEWILDFDARLRKVETRLADGLEGIADKLGDMQGSMIALRQAHIVTSQSVGGIKRQLEQTRLASPDYTDRLLTILETQQANHGRHGEGARRWSGVKQDRSRLLLGPEVAAFAVQMELKLRENDHKPHWRESSLSYLIARLREECGELIDAALYEEGSTPDHITKEAADVANFAMFIADVAGGLRLDTEDVGSVIQLNKNMAATKEHETDIPVWRWPTMQGHEHSCGLLLLPRLR